MKFKIGDVVTIIAEHPPCLFGTRAAIVSESHESVRHRLPWCIEFPGGGYAGYAEDELAPWFVPEKHRALSAGRLAP